MEVKVFCQCGSKYKFDVEPVNERMPWPVNCPTCGADGTAQANQIIAQTFAANPAVPPPAPSPLAMSAPPPPPAPAYAPAPAPTAAAPCSGSRAGRLADQQTCRPTAAGGPGSDDGRRATAAAAASGRPAAFHAGDVAADRAFRASE